jgi:hypothetical protein
VLANYLAIPEDSEVDSDVYAPVAASLDPSEPGAALVAKIAVNSASCVG